ncbi:MAG: TIGR01777 family protein [Omnitrophica bacterium RIFCSPHIGHO2_02_FULL_46_11]|nr:MAG: TIGR01777 family protein [Omnitrophica bacterium RIFCSPHIGHO2_02_FULL_46_11]OGW86240.1 MAG: TIGR01777 family protein [Omnitrophica bacterium RIFCSPLOWO2_01_FULL_45_10b]
MKIIVTGASGFIGRALCEALLNRGEDLILLTRASSKAPRHSKASVVVWNPEDSDSIVNEIDGSDAVINLAGEPVIGKRWTNDQKQKILESRVHATKIIANSIKKATHKPKVLINASAVGYYGPHGNEVLDEETGPGNDFLAEACKTWEAHAMRVEDFGVRVVRLRIGIVLSRGGGALQIMIPPFKMFLGGWLGSGNQWMSWIRRSDLVRLVLFCLDHPEAKGAINAVAPQPVTNKVFSMVLAQVLSKPCLFPVPGFALKMFMGEVADMLLTGQRVSPKKAQSLGFSFQYPELRRALGSTLNPHDE